VVCHEQKPGKIAGFGMAWAHNNCIDCHDLYQEATSIACARLSLDTATCLKIEC
jgi:hypothetical protein